MCIRDRLECTRCSGLGISAARSIFSEEFLHEYLAVGRDVGSARAVSKVASSARSGTVVVFASHQRFHLRHQLRGALANAFHANVTSNHADKLSKPLLEHCPTTSSSRRERV